MECYINIILLFLFTINNIFIILWNISRVYTVHFDWIGLFDWCDIVLSIYSHNYFVFLLY